MWMKLADREGDDSLVCFHPGAREEGSDQNLKCSILVGRHTRSFKLKNHFVLCRQSISHQASRISLPGKNNLLDHF